MPLDYYSINPIFTAYWYGKRAMTKMVDQAEDSKKLWFLRVEGTLLGPFPSAKVRNLLTNGELSLSAEISKDRVSWNKIQAVPEVVPLKMRAQMGDRAAQTLVHARRVAEQQSRTGESHGFPVAALLVISLLITGIIGVSIWSGLPQEAPVSDCSAQAAPGVNWNHCVLIGIDAGSASLAGANLSNASLRQAKLTATNLTGADLRYSDLSGADMSYAQLNRAVLLGANLQRIDLSDADLADADLRFADLTGSRLEHAILNGANLSEAIWIDGKPCAAGSVGKCLR